MKKFLSLLLALTLVLSLVVVPARADYTENATGSITVSADKNSATEGDEVQFSVSSPTISYNGQNYNATITSYKWNNDNGQIGETYTTTAGSSNLTASCTVELSYTIPASGTTEAPVAAQTITASATNSATVQVQSNADAFKAAIQNITYNGRRCVINGNDVTYYTFTNDPSTPVWKAEATGGYTVETVSLSQTSLTVKGKRGNTSVSTTFTANNTPASLSISGNPSDGRVISGGSILLTATPTGFTTPYSVPSYSWTVDGQTYNTNVENSFRVPPLTNITSQETTKEITCTASVETDSSGTISVTNTYTVTIVPGICTLSLSSTPLMSNNTISLTSIGSRAEIVATLKDSDNKAIDPAKVSYGWITSGNSNGAYTISGTNSNTLRATLNTSGTITLTPYATYMGRAFYATPKEVRVVSSLLEATLSSTYYGANNGYYTSESLKNYANEALKSSLSSYDYVTSVVIDTASGSRNANGLGQFSNVYNDRITFTPYINSFGKATFTASVSTYRGLSYTVTFSIPVTPVPVNSFDSQTAEPVSTTTTNTNYKVSAPYGYTKFYVLGNSNSLTASQTVDYSRYSAYQLNSMGYTYTTIPSTYFSTSGQCTLYVIAWNDTTTSSSYSKYYCGPMTVTQTNYNINYNGVAGETVQFAQSDFTDFMNEVAEARGDASKTKSYPYVTFDYVTFSLPTTAQGTLYYGGTAMSTSNSSGAFNTRTKVTNLDSVTFVPNAKTTAKTITLNFTLYATRYSSSSTSLGTTVSYSGTVVVNLVREDIKYTVSQGDSVRFDESDFLNYLRSTKGYTSNYTIDYVTFDQSAVSAVNEGSLYTYYNGYNYGGSVKTTDKFYYNAAASQNALSDVAFLASRYAKTGETVYIPFTIYARYGTTGTGTRQLTGTVAIKIGQTMNFIDVKTTDYFYNSVKWAVGKNITNGTSSTTFSPYKSCTRAEIVTFLWRAAGSPEPTITRNPFRDVNAVTHSSYYKAILWASQKGITSGTSATAFSPDQVCTRAQIVTFLYRYAGQPSGYYSNPFKDVGATSEASYYNAIRWAVGKGITTGTSATTFSPYASCNRAEAVTFLYRYTNGL